MGSMSRVREVIDVTFASSHPCGAETTPCPMLESSLAKVTNEPFSFITRTCEPSEMSSRTASPGFIRRAGESLLLSARMKSAELFLPACRPEMNTNGRSVGGTRSAGLKLSRRLSNGSGKIFQRPPGRRFLTYRVGTGISTPCDPCAATYAASPRPVRNNPISRSSSAVRSGSSPPKMSMPIWRATCPSTHHSGRRP